VAGRINSLDPAPQESDKNPLRILQGARRRLFVTGHHHRHRHEREPSVKRTIIVGLATAALVSGGLGLAAGTAQAYTYGPFQWCPGQDLPNDPPRPDGSLVWDMSVCHTYYFDYDIRDPGTPARYWEGRNLFPTPIPPPPPPANPPNLSEQCPGLIPFVNCLPGL
jgi:hypothetical protein